LAGAVSEANSTDLSKIGFMRAARTDKGVHAAGQVVSFKMITEDPDIVAKINQHLPDQIRVWGYVRTINSFHAKNRCQSRIYEYLCPTYVFRELSEKEREDAGYGQPPTREDIENAKQVQIQKNQQRAENGPKSNDNVYDKHSSEAEMSHKREHRLNPATLSDIREALSLYEGTHNFHNFTIGKCFQEKSAQRHIIKIEVRLPCVSHDARFFLYVSLMTVCHLSLVL
jgi:tRNA pseudouridine38-40 synthase